jgi:hypothetical protein
VLALGRQAAVSGMVEGHEKSMEKELEVFVTGFEYLTSEERHRARRADCIYAAAVTEFGVKLDAFRRPPAWVEFVKGLIDEPELWEKVMVELANRTSFLGKAV